MVLQVKSHQIKKIEPTSAEKGIKTLNKNFYNEFVIEVSNSDEFLAKLKANGILGGLKLDSTKLLVATTELTTENDLELYISGI